MPTPTLADLPLPPPGRTGWPWTTAPAPLPPTMRSGAAWPTISLVTPSYNHAHHLEETIRSVLLQGYPHLEYHVLDGGSQDDSVAILRKYGRWLTSWVSQPDRGQSDAINQGFARSGGEIFNWLCSDDLLQPHALEQVARTFVATPECDVVVGDCECVDEREPARSGVRLANLARLQHSPFVAAIWQPSCFFRRTLVARPQLVQERLHFCMDRELWCYFHQRGARWQHLPVSLSVNRFTGTNKSVVGRDAIIAEIDTLYRDYVHEPIPLTAWLRHVWLPLVRAQKSPTRPASVRLVSGILSRAVSATLRLLYPGERVKLLRAEYYGYAMW